MEHRDPLPWRTSNWGAEGRSPLRGFQSTGDKNGHDGRFDSGYVFRLVVSPYVDEATEKGNARRSRFRAEAGRTLRQEEVLRTDDDPIEGVSAANVVSVVHDHDIGIAIFLEQEEVRAFAPFEYILTLSVRV